MLAYSNVVRMCLAGDVGSLEEGVKFANKYRRAHEITDEQHAAVIERHGWSDYHWKSTAPEPVIPLQFRRKEAEEEAKVEDYELPSEPFVEAGTKEHYAKFGYDYGPRNTFSSLMFNARANAKTVKAYEEKEPEPEPEPEPEFVLGDGWSDESEPEPEPEPEREPEPEVEAVAVVERPATPESPATPPPRAITRADARAVDAAVRSRLQALEKLTKIPLDVRVDLEAGRLVVPRQRMVKWGHPNTDDVRTAEGRRVVAEIGLALRHLDEECAARDLPLTASVRVKVRCGDDRPLSDQQRSQADRLSLRRARRVRRLVLEQNRSIREESVVALVGGVAPKPDAPAVHVALALERRRVLPAAATKLRAKSKALLFLGAAAAAADGKGDY